MLLHWCLPLHCHNPAPRKKTLIATLSSHFTFRRIRLHRLLTKNMVSQTLSGICFVIFNVRLFSNSKPETPFQSGEIPQIPFNDHIFFVCWSRQIPLMFFVVGRKGLINLVLEDRLVSLGKWTSIWMFSAMILKQQGCQRCMVLSKSLTKEQQNWQILVDAWYNPYIEWSQQSFFWLPFMPSRFATQNNANNSKK